MTVILIIYKIIIHAEKTMHPFFSFICQPICFLAIDELWYLQFKTSLLKKYKYFLLSNFVIPISIDIITHGLQFYYHIC